MLRGKKKQTALASAVCKQRKGITMLITILHKDDNDEESRVDVRLLPAVPQPASYVVTTGFDIRAACSRKYERILVERDFFEFQVSQRYQMKLHRWGDIDTAPWHAIDNKHSAEQWVTNNIALFSVSFIGVYVNSDKHVLTLYIPDNARVEAKTDESHIIL